MSNFSNFNFSGGDIFKALPCQAVFTPTLSKISIILETSSIFGKLIIVVLPSLSKEASKIATAEFLEALTVISLSTFSAVDYIICHSKTIIMFLNFLEKNRAVSYARILLLMPEMKSFLTSSLSWLAILLSTALCKAFIIHFFLLAREKEIKQRETTGGK